MDKAQNILNGLLASAADVYNTKLVADSARAQARTASQQAAAQNATATSNRNLFVLGAVALTVLVGLVLLFRK